MNTFENFGVNKQENSAEKLKKALDIVDSVDNTYEALVEKVKEIAESNKNLELGFYKYGIGNNFESLMDFKFPLGIGGISEGIFFKDDKALGRYVQKNIEYVSVDNLEDVAGSFKKRVGEVIKRLDRPYSDGNDAYDEIQSVHKDLILKTIEGDDIIDRRAK